jgi:hypothetical protein
MRYLTLSADYGHVALRNEIQGATSPADLRLPDQLVTDLMLWNGRYQPVIPADTNQRSSEPMASLITELDKLGLALAGRIAHAIGDGTKVKYYSEGLLGHLT